MKLRLLCILCLCLTGLYGQPETPVEQWTGKTVLLIAAHPDDDSRAHGTLALLRNNGNEVHVALLTTGNVGTQDPNMSRFRLAQVRRREELAALAEIGVAADHYVNLGYDDGLVEFEDRKSVVERLVRLIRKIRPDVLFAWDPGKGYQRWHKSDHRAAAYLAADAARAAMWRLLFEGQVIHEGLEAFQVPEYLFFGGVKEDVNTWVDISSTLEKKLNAAAKYVSQFSSGWSNYTGPELSAEEQKQLREGRLRRVLRRNGKPVEGFRHYKGLPDGIGS
ncbi:MAG: PIG-L deacetylase family protein [Acidobacteriota bacterium]